MSVNYGELIPGVQNQINRIRDAIADSYTAVSEKGGTVPSSQNVANLASAIGSIPTGSAKNVQAVLATTDIKSTSYTMALSLTVAKTGVYNVSWIGIRNSTSGTNGSQLYVNGTAYGSANTTFQSGNTYMQQPYLTNVSLTEGQTIEVRARSRTTAAAMTIGNFAIAEV